MFPFEAIPFFLQARAAPAASSQHPPAFFFPQQRGEGGELLTRDVPRCQSVCLSSRGEPSLRVQPSSSDCKLQTAWSVPKPGNATPLPPGQPPSPRVSSDAGAETEFLESFEKMLIIYGDFSPCAALKGPGTLNKNIVYFIKLNYSSSGVVSIGMKGDPGPTSQLPASAQLLGVELVVLTVAPHVSPQAQHQAPIALAGQVGAPGALSCRMGGHQGVSPGFGG